jgi:hypothetical protein
MKKIFNQKNFNNCVGTPLDSRVDIYINFCLQVHFKVSAAILFPLFPAGIVDTGGIFATGMNNISETGGKICRLSLISVANLAPVSFIPVAILPPVSLTSVANLPSVSLIPVVHLYLRISPQIFEKFETVLMGHSVRLGGN